MSKDTIKKVKRQSTDWEKIFSNHIFDRGHESRVYKEYLTIKKDNPIFKMSKGSEQTFLPTRCTNGQ